MMKILNLLHFGLIAFFLASQANAAPRHDAAANSFHVLSYHNVLDDPETLPDRHSISTAQLVQHFAWLRDQGYAVVSVDDILRARSGGKPLPVKAVLLSFDDAYKSFNDKVMPLLRTYNYPAVLAIVGRWLDIPQGEAIPYENFAYQRKDFLDWDDVREISRSGLVEIASHSYDLHQGVQGNPQGNLIPAAVARAYSNDSASYEDEKAYLKRVRDDLARNNARIREVTGKSPRVMVWPYGRYSNKVISLAGELGMPVTLTLDDGRNEADTPLPQLKRNLLIYNPSVAELADALAPPQHRPALQRVMHVDLDYVFDPDPVQQEANLSILLDRVRAMGVNVVYLQAYADPDGNGAANQMYFPNRHLPMRADLFNRVAWQLHTRGGVKVYAWMPVLAFELPASHPDAGRRVATHSAARKQDGYPRLSPFDPRARQVVRDIYEDLATHALFQGILFHDDATLSDFEDNSPAALEHYARVWQLPADLDRIRAEPDSLARWTRLKTRHLTEWTLELAALAGRSQSNLLTARNLYAPVLDNPQSETWFAQSWEDFLASYDYAAVMAMPYMEEVKNPRDWLIGLTDKALAHQLGKNKALFELQTRDWRTQQPLDSTLLAEQMVMLQLAGMLNLGYYPDDFLRNHPRIEIIKPAISLQSFPYRRGKQP